MSAFDWRWSVFDELGVPWVCNECGDDIHGVPYVYSGDRNVCLDCACLILNAREDLIKEMQQELDATDSNQDEAEKDTDK